MSVSQPRICQIHLWLVDECVCARISCRQARVAVGAGVGVGVRIKCSNVAGSLSAPLITRLVQLQLQRANCSMTAARRVASFAYQLQHE